jgi:hypothetical protein
MSSSQQQQASEKEEFNYTNQAHKSTEQKRPLSCDESLIDSLSL